MNIACTMAPGRGDTDQLLFSVAQKLRDQGYRVCGTVQVNTEREKTGPCDMDVKVMPDGPMLRISQNLGSGARGCRLDAHSLETAVGLVDAALAKGADCLIINKFGKQEAEGHGFRDVIAQALSLGIPVLVGMNQLNRAAFEAFAEGLSVELEPKHHVLTEWLHRNMDDALCAA